MCLLKSTGFLTQLLPQDTAKARNYIQLSPTLLLEASVSPSSVAVLTEPTDNA